MFAPGAVVAGKYRIETMLGQGGMGVVLAATHLHLGTRVALKFLHEEMAQHPSIVERFLREAQAAAALRSEHVCRVTDVAMEGTIPYIVMELLHGRDLATMLRMDGVLPVPALADYILQASHAIAEAHALGIVHRDLKPGNLFVTQRPDGRPLVKVLDFGIAKAPSSSRDFSLTQTANVLGSPGYMSPEQLKSSKVVDARADIWSLGIVMYELLVGRPPFSGESITELALSVAMDPLPTLPPGVPGPMVAIVARCLEKDVGRRFADVAELANALAPFAANGRDQASGIAYVLRGQAPPLAQVAPVTSTPTTLRAASGMLEGGSGAPRRRGGLIAGVAVGVAALGIATAVIVSRGGNGGTAAATQPAPTDKAAEPPKGPMAEDGRKVDRAKTEAPKSEDVKAEKSEASLAAEAPHAETPTSTEAKSEPAKAEAAKAAPKSEPAKAEAKAVAKSEPAKAEPQAAKAVPKSEPAKAAARPKVEPAKVEPKPKVEAKPKVEPKKEPKKPTVEEIGESRD